MMMNLFHQFSPSEFLGLPLSTIAMLIPWLLFSSSTRWQNNRQLTIQLWLMKKLTKEIFSPLNYYSHKWSLILISLLTFLLSINLLGLLPYTFTPTTQLSLNLAMAVPLWLSTVTLGIRYQTSHSLAHLLPEGTPTPLIPILIMIETTSLLIRPLALAVRLTANLTAGHLLIQLISTAVLSNFLLSSLTFSILLAFTILEIAVAMIQAFVFVLLLSLYLQENTDYISSF